MRDKELWNMTVEIEASKLEQITSTLDLEHYHFNIHSQHMAEYKKKVKKAKHEKVLADWHSGRSRNPMFNMRNGFGRTTKNR